MGTVFKSCKKCTKRTIGCHSWCKEHAREKKEHAELMEDIRARRESDYYIIGQQEMARGKAAKKKKKQGPYDYK